MSNVYCKLPFSRTCSYTLILCEEYENVEEFIESFKICLSNSEGFSEISYGRIRNLINNSSTIDINERGLNNIRGENIVNEEQEDIINEERRENIIDEEQREDIIDEEQGENIIDEEQGENIVDEEQREDITNEEQRNAPQESMDIINEGDDNIEHNNIETIDLTNDNQIIIDIHRETIAQKKKRKKRRQQINSEATIQSQSNKSKFINVTAEDIVNATSNNRKKKKPSQNARSQIITRSMKVRNEN